MKTTAVIQIYERSVEKHTLFCKSFIADSDCPDYRELCKINAYGPTKLNEKEEDIEHVIKRVSSQLQSIVSDYKDNRITSISLIFGHVKIFVIIIYCSIYEETVKISSLL